MSETRDIIIEQFYPDKVTILDFFNLIDDKELRENFIENMKNLKYDDMKYPEKWMDIFSRWSELK